MRPECDAPVGRCRPGAGRAGEGKKRPSDTLVQVRLIRKKSWLSDGSWASPVETRSMAHRLDGRSLDAIQESTPSGGRSRWLAPNTPYSRQCFARVPRDWSPRRRDQQAPERDQFNRIQAMIEWSRASRPYDKTPCHAGGGDMGRPRRVFGEGSDKRSPAEDIAPERPPERGRDEQRLRSDEFTSGLITRRRHRIGAGQVASGRSSHITWRRCGAMATALTDALRRYPAAMRHVGRSDHIFGPWRGP